jgi:hypothetical protein
MPPGRLVAAPVASGSTKSQAHRKPRLAPAHGRRPEETLGCAEGQGRSGSDAGVRDGRQEEAPPHPRGARADHRGDQDLAQADFYGRRLAGRRRRESDRHRGGRKAGGRRRRRWRKWRRARGPPPRNSGPARNVQPGNGASHNAVSEEPAGGWQFKEPTTRPLSGPRISRKTTQTSKRSGTSWGNFGLPCPPRSDLSNELEVEWRVDPGAPWN